MTLFLLDNSVQQRLGVRPEVSAAVQELATERDVLCASDVLRLEAGFFARSRRDHERVLDILTHTLRLLPLTPDAGKIAVALQSALFAVGKGRAAGVLDLLHAATAIVHDAVVVHYDEDFETLAGVDERLRHQWVVPRGSVD